MVAAMSILALLVIVALVAVALGLRSYGRDEARTEARLLSPDAHTIAYLVPPGEDPAVVRAGIRRGGYPTVVDLTHDPERVLIECAPSDRDAVRSLIEQARRSALAEWGITVGPITFEDEA